MVTNFSSGDMIMWMTVEKLVSIQVWMKFSRALRKHHIPTKPSSKIPAYPRQLPDPSRWPPRWWLQRTQVTEIVPAHVILHSMPYTWTNWIWESTALVTTGPSFAETSVASREGSAPSSNGIAIEYSGNRLTDAFISREWIWPRIHGDFQCCISFSNVYNIPRGNDETWCGQGRKSGLIYWSTRNSKQVAKGKGQRKVWYRHLISNIPYITEWYV